MSNDFYNATGNPPTGGAGSSANMRSEFAAIAAGFDKLPALSTAAYKIVYVNAAGAALATFGGNGLLKLSSSAIPALAVAGTDFYAPGSDLALTVGKALIFEGATDDAFETNLYVVDPTADNVLLLPNKSGTLATTADVPTIPDFFFQALGVI